MKTYKDAYVSRLGGNWSSGYYPYYPDTTGAIRDIRNSSELSSAWHSTFGQNMGTVIGPYNPDSMAYTAGYSYGTLVSESLESFPPTEKYQGKVRSNNNPGFLKKKATGVMVVAPYQAFEINYTYRMGLVAGEVSSTIIKQSNSRAYDLSPALYWSLPRQFHHPFDSDVTPVNGKRPRYDGSYFSPFFLDRVDTLSTDVHPKTVGWSDPFINVGSLTSLIDVNLDELVTSAHAEAESGTYDLLTEVMELPETVRYLINILGTAVTAFKAAKGREVEVRKLYRNRKQTLKSAKELADAVASVWLQYRYAISPLAYSIEDIQETLLSMKAKYGKYNEKSVSSINFPETLEFRGSSAVWHLVTNDSSATVRCFIKRKYDPQDIIDTLYGLLKVNPFSTAWELIPLSFVADWFVNVGDYITALTSHQPHTQQVSTVSIKLEGNVSYKDSVSGCAVDIDFEAYDRTVIDPDDFVSLQFRFDLNWKRQIDALALLWGPVSKSLTKAINKR